MSKKTCRWKTMMLLACLMAWLCGLTALAEGLSGDNSLSTLGILTEGTTVTPDFVYSTIEYQVTVPAGTAELVVDPITSNPAARIVDISGTTLTNGEGTVVITVNAEDGTPCSYYLYVTSAPAQTEAVQTESETQPPTEPQTEPQTEDPRYVKVDRNSLEEAENTIAALKAETASYRDRVSLLMKLLYGMIAFCVVLLFVVVNLILKKRDLKAELRDYMSYGYAPEDGGDGGYGYGQDYGYGEADGAGGYPPEADGAGGYPPEADGAGGDPGEGSGADGEAAWDGHGTGQDAAAAENHPSEAPGNDDPETVPKASRAKKKPKKMPQYQQPEPAPQYQPGGGATKAKDVEITMIDL